MTTTPVISETIQCSSSTTDPAEITINPSDEYAFPGDFIELLCYAFGIPSANVIWSRPGIEDLAFSDNENITVVSELTPDGVTLSSLLFDYVQPSDTATYTCTVFNEVENLIGVIQEASAELVVLEELCKFGRIMCTC